MPLSLNVFHITICYYNLIASIISIFFAYRNNWIYLNVLLLRLAYKLGDIFFFWINQKISLLTNQFCTLSTFCMISYIILTKLQSNKPAKIIFLNSMQTNLSCSVFHYIFASLHQFCYLNDLLSPNFHIPLIPHTLYHCCHCSLI